jgi:hypothetical protein
MEKTPQLERCQTHAKRLDVIWKNREISPSIRKSLEDLAGQHLLRYALSSSLLSWSLILRPLFFEHHSNCQG